MAADLQSSGMSVTAHKAACQEKVMIQAMNNQRLDAPEMPPSQKWVHGSDFADLFGDASKAVSKAMPVAPASADTTVPIQTSLGDPDIVGWLDGGNPAYATAAANADYEAAPGAGNNYAAGTVYGPDAVYQQALDNIIGNSFASLTGQNPAQCTSQLPGIATPQAQQTFDQRLAEENAGRLASGQPIDTTAYWADPGPMTVNGITYTSQELGYAGPGQSSGPQPIFISQANQIPGTNTFSVPCYNGTVSGIQPGRYYTLQQLEKAGLPAGQADGQAHPGSWTLTQSV
ncbi:MAG: hypothetical protein ABSC93_29085 [Bryobacteraceae bacterium]|jgi:hypothetical protein